MIYVSSTIVERFLRMGDRKRTTKSGICRRAKRLRDSFRQHVDPQVNLLGFLLLPQGRFEHLPHFDRGPATC